MANTKGKKSTDLRKVKPLAFIASFGVVSMLMDIVYQAALSVQGPLLASLGASAAIVGLVSGLGEATSLIGRLFSGPLADKTGRYWLLAILGYAATGLAVPAMGFVGSLVGVSALIILERFGKSLRTPSRDAMLSHAASAVGTGKGFALHEVMDQIGAFGGPLLVAALLQFTNNDFRIALGVTLIPGAAAIIVLLALRSRVPDPATYELDEKATASASAQNADPAAIPSASVDPTDPPSATVTAAGTAAPTAGEVARQLPRLFWTYTICCGLVLAGVATFGVLSFHMVDSGLVPTAAVPAIYAIAQLVDALFAWLTGNAFDRKGPRTLLILPVVCAVIPFFAFGGNVFMVITGTMLWGAALGIQESTMRAAIAGMVPKDARATAYGLFSVAIGVGGLIGGVMAGVLYDIAPWAFIIWSVVIEGAAFLILRKTL